MGRDRGAEPSPGPIRSNSMVAAALALAMQGCMDAESNAPTDRQRAATGPIPAVVTERCGQCHLPPRRAAHPAKEWPSVVERMQRHIAQKGKRGLTAGERAAILDYLMNGAGGR